jgi:hypothetical protein
MKRILAGAALAAILCAPAALGAQSSDEAGPAKGSTELEVWSGAGGAVPINGSAAPVTEWNLGLRYGRVLTDAHGPGLLNGRFEYSFDIVPAFLLFQPRGTVYGGGSDPVAVKWEFRTRRHIAPFFEISGGSLFTTDPVPPLGTSFNFTVSTALGAHVIRGKHAWSIDVRWFHVSNAHIIKYDPGINAVQVRIGFGLFIHPK